MKCSRCGKDDVTKYPPGSKVKYPANVRGVICGDCVQTMLGMKRVERVFIRGVKQLRRRR
uniref:Uncharacterized protein n=1 Tax=viral metagenome TaxID=1070528 RepID=A0A6M3KZ80_9ZZZZ